ncbi:hypothetical protein [Streptosporangium vulgare]|uniref:hypothetical protein n=1 Tax=Streptosporangium vulgare TaxID=46190 RepID=UPI0036DB7F0D
MLFLRGGECNLHPGEAFAGAARYAAEKTGAVMAGLSRPCGPPTMVDQAVDYLSASQADPIEISGWSRGMWWLRGPAVS